MGSLDKMVILPCRAGERFAERIVYWLNEREYGRREGKGEIELMPASIWNFPGKEIITQIGKSVRKKSVFIVQRFSQEASPPLRNDDKEGEEGKLTPSDLNNDLVELLVANNTANLADAAEIINVCPYMVYQRQDGKPKGRQPITASLVMRLLRCAAGDHDWKLITTDLHAKQAAGYVDSPVITVDSLPLNIIYLNNHPVLKNEDKVIVAPDAGAVERAEKIAGYLKIPMAVIGKEHREEGSKPKYLIGDVRGKTAIIVDDMMGTCGTTVNSANLLRKHGAKPRVYAMASAGLFNRRYNKPFPEQILYESGIEVITTDAIPRPEGYGENSPWLRRLSLAKLYSDITLSVYRGDETTADLDRHIERALSGESSIKDYLLPPIPPEFGG